MVQVHELLSTPHWSTDIPLVTPHRRLDVFEEAGIVSLRDLDERVPESDWMSLEYMNWKSGGDTNFAPIATADGKLDCRGFWKPGDERPDKGGRWAVNAAHCPGIVAHVEAAGADFGRVRVIRLETPGSRAWL